MKKVLSIRMTEVLTRALREEAAERKMSLSACVAWIIDIALQDGLDLSPLTDVRELLDGKIDCRLPAEILSRLRPVCRRYAYVRRTHREIETQAGRRSLHASG